MGVGRSPSAAARGQLSLPSRGRGAGEPSSESGRAVAGVTAAVDGGNVRRTGKENTGLPPQWGATRETRESERERERESARETANGVNPLPRRVESGAVAGVTAAVDPLPRRVESGASSNLSSASFLQRVASSGSLFLERSASYCSGVRRGVHPERSESDPQVRTGEFFLFCFEKFFFVYIYCSRSESDPQVRHGEAARDAPSRALHRPSM